MILVTGGTGLLGSHLLYELVRKRHKVIATRRYSSNLEEVKRIFAYYSPKAEELFDKICWVEADLENQVEVEGVLKGVDKVYHCAAMVSFQPKERERMIGFNVRSTASVVNACQATGIKKLLHVSSSSAIGRAPEGVLADENMIWAYSKTSSGYAVSKFKSEMEVWRGIEEGLNAVIVNPTIIFGPGFWDRGSSSIFTRVSRGLRVSTPGVTGYVGVQDVVRAMIRLMDSDISGERFIISEGNYSFTDIFRMIRGALWEYGKHPKNRQHIRTISRSTLQRIVHLDAFWGFLTGRRNITSDQVLSAFSEVRFSNEKIRKAIGIEFKPVIEVIDQVAETFVKDRYGRR